MQLTQEQLNRLQKLAKVLDSGDIGLLQMLDEIESKTKEELEQIRAVVSHALEVAETTKKLQGEKGEKGDKGDKGERGADGKDGKDGLNGKDGKDGVDGKDGKDGRDGVDGKDGLDGEMGMVDEATIAYLEDRADKVQLDIEAYDRGLSIVDQRTSYLVNKTSNLEKNKIDGVGVHTITVGDTAPTDPAEGDLWIDTNGYTFKAVTGTYTLTATDYFVGASGTFTVTLPTAVSFGGEYIIKNTGSGTITVDTTSSQTIDGALTVSLIPDEVIVVRSNGTNWFIV